MPVNFLDAVEQARLNDFPAEIIPPDIHAYFTLTETEAGKQLIANHRGEDNKLGVALQLATLRYLGFCPKELQTVPRPVVTYLVHNWS